MSTYGVAQPVPRDATPRSVDVLSSDYAERVYAGVLGKIIGVYLGRPVEGWPYEDIQNRFGLVEDYINGEVGDPLIVADDDISGTFAFARSVLDHSDETLAPAHVGSTWLNYIIEDRTILWWGGLGRSTEHTAYLNLRNGIPAPQSGSIAQNGSTLAEQIGAQIFSDAFALMAPGDPELAVALTRAGASVSHDGDALEAASFLAAMRSLAFTEANLETLLDSGVNWVSSPKVLTLIEDVRTHCTPAMPWQDIRAFIDDRYGYSRYPGPCHSLSNLAMSLGALLGAGDDFRRGVAIASSVGFDTDSNAGTVGCLNGVRLGLDAIPDRLRLPVADRMLVVTADGGECVSDASRETRKIVQSAARLAGLPRLAEAPRMDFALRGSIHGFSFCPYADTRESYMLVHDTHRDTPSLRVDVAPTGTLISTPTFLDPADDTANFSTLASPSLYPGQTVTATLSATGHVAAQLYVLYQSSDGVLTRHSHGVSVGAGPTRLDWQVPALGNLVPFRLGMDLQPESPEATTVHLHEVNWDGAPQHFEQQGILLSSIWDTKPSALRPWVSSAKNFEADFAVTYSVSHPQSFGLVTTGGRDWVDYAAGTDMTFSLHNSAGLVVRSRGHRRFAAAVFSGGHTVSLVRQYDDARTVLASRSFSYQPDHPYRLRLECEGQALTLFVDDERLLTAQVDEVLGGGAGFFIDTGTVLADGFCITSLTPTATNQPTRKAHV